MKVNFHPDAIEKLLESQEWYYERSRIAARAFTTEFAWSIRQIISYLLEKTHQRDPHV